MCPNPVPSACSSPLLPQRFVTTGRIATVKPTGLLPSVTNLALEEAQTAVPSGKQVNMAPVSQKVDAGLLGAGATGQACPLWDPECLCPSLKLSGSKCYCPPQPSLSFGPGSCSMQLRCSWPFSLPATLFSMMNCQTCMNVTVISKDFAKGSS